jgi:hypothetical protein
MKPLSDQLMDLAEHTKKIEDTASASREKNRKSLERTREELKSDIDERARMLVDLSHRADDSLSAWWDRVKSAVDERFSTMDAKLAERKAERDEKRAARRADEAEEDAAGLIAFAAYAVEASEYAVVDAALARAEADDLAAAAR